MLPDQARREAVLEFGGAEQLKEELRDIHRLPFIESAVTHLKFALRLLRKSPGFSLTVILTLTLGIGANSAVFSAIDSVLLRPLPFPESHQLVLLLQYDRTSEASPIAVAPVRLEDWNRLNHTFQAVSGFYTDDVSDTTGEIPEKVTEALVAPRFFRVWGVAPALGRDFNTAEEHYGGPNSVIISHRLWIHRFNGDPHVLGKQLRLEKTSQTVVGVMPANFSFIDHDVDIWMSNPPDAPYAQSRGNTWFRVIGRMKPGVTLAQAGSDLAAVQAELGRQFPATDGKLSIQFQRLKDTLISDASRSLWLIYAAVSLLLVLACANIAALLLARSSQRAHEISIRFALGASRRSIILQLLTECGLLAFAGALGGLFIAATGSGLLRNFARGIARRDEISLNWQIVLYTFASAIAVTLLCGLIPAIRGTSRDSNSELARRGRWQVSARFSLQWLLVVTQIALAVMLLVGAGLLLRSFQELNRTQLGFETSHILTFRVSANWGETTNYPALIKRINRTLESIRATPGVIDAATTASLPGIPAGASTSLKVVMKTERTATDIVAQSRFVSTHYFKTLEIPLLTGEACRESTDNTAVLVNHSFVEAYLGNGPPLGHQVAFASNPFNAWPARIIGVVANVRDQGRNIAPSPTIYWCTSAPFPSPYFLIHTRTEPMALAETLRRKIHTLEPNRSVFGLSPLEEHLSDNFAETRLRTLLLSVFALTAILLASTGLYGTLNYLVAIRQREIGLRLALGALRSQIILSFLKQGLLAAAFGCAAGLCLAAACSHLLAGMLFGVARTDAQTFSGVILLVLTVVIGASLAPALRAATVEPMQVLREE